MARYWKPKYPVICTKCGWKGKRTHATMHYLCPRCYPHEKATKKFKFYAYFQNVKHTIKKQDKNL